MTAWSKTAPTETGWYWGLNREIWDYPSAMYVEPDWRGELCICGVAFSTGAYAGYEWQPIEKWKS